MNRRNLVWQVFFLVVVVSFAACGRKGPPVPPESFYPGPVLRLSANGTSEGVALNWLAPSRTQNGRTLKDLASFSIRRRITDSEEDFTELSTLEAKPVAPQQLPAGVAAAGEEYAYLDKTVEPGTTYDYIVVPLNTQQNEGLLGVIVRGARQEQAG